MTDIFVNNIYHDNEIINGVAILNHTVLKDLSIIYSGNKLDNLNLLIKSSPKDPFYFFDKFCQFNTFFQYDPTLGLSLKFTDFQNNDDLALDEYLVLKEKQWQQQDREKIMRLYHEIKTSNPTKANLVIQDPVK